MIFLRFFYIAMHSQSSFPDDIVELFVLNPYSFDCHFTISNQLDGFNYLNSVRTKCLKFIIHKFPALICTLLENILQFPHLFSDVFRRLLDFGKHISFSQIRGLSKTIAVVLLYYRVQTRSKIIDETLAPVFLFDFHIF